MFLKTFPKTLHGKLSLILLGLLCLLGGFSGTLALFTTETYQQEVAQNLNRPLAASLASHLAARRLLSDDPAALRQARAEIKSLMAINPNVDVYLLDMRGAVLAYSGAPGDVQQGHVSLAPLRRFLSGSGPLPILGDDPRTPGRRKVFSVAPFPLSGQFPPTRGYVYVILGGEQYGSVAGLLGRSYVLRSSTWALAATLAVVSAAGLLLFHLVTRRLRWLTASMETFRDQDYRNPAAVLSARLFTPWPGIVYRRDEIDRLGMVHLEMTNRIRGQILEIAQSDARRLEMVSNVSHDLRTPLAALQGYLETLLMKEGELSPAQQREYLAIALSHSERLTTLVAELFELARLDTQETPPRPEPFALGELAQDMVQQFGLAGEKKGVFLRLETPEETLFVFADIGLIARVLENLLENALRHTPPGGQIVVHLARVGDRVSLQVADTGEGIPAEHLPHVFERSYRVPSSGGGTGLGLAISQRILELHGSKLGVESEAGHGAVFTFSLPVCTAPVSGIEVRD